MKGLATAKQNAVSYWRAFQRIFARTCGFLWATRVIAGESKRTREKIKDKTTHGIFPWIDFFSRHQVAST